MHPIRQLLIFFALLAALLDVAYVLRARAEARFLEYPLYADKLARIDAGRPARILLFGESRTVGVTGRPELADEHGLYNLAMPALQGIFPSVYLFERYLQSNPAPRAVVLGSDPLAYSGWRDLLAGGVHGADPALSYHYRYASRVFDLGDLLFEEEMWRRPRTLYRLAEAKLSLNKFYVDFQQPSNAQLFDPRVGTGLFARPPGWQWTPSHQRLSERPFDVNPVVRGHLERLIETARAHGSKVVAYHPPIYSRMYETRVEHGFYEAYGALLDELEATHTETFIAWRPIVALGHDAFVDGKHYSEAGSEQAADRSLAPMLEWLEGRL